ncbi:MAG: phosphoribosylanthranilate isomerase [Gammaproteobacteria bacterium]|nr:phosphoribosylanthranilate isomerase [Gammaproteobacteria bacterium]
MAVEPSGRIRVKICGITQPQDAAWAGACGADAIGLVFYPPSPRAVDAVQARRIVAALPPFVSLVALFVDPDPEWVRRVLAALPVDLLQFHGDESPELCESFGRPYVKAVAMREGIDLHAVGRRYGSARGLLLDSFHQGLRGGTGVTFDWSRVPRDLGRPVILAGGLDPGNVAEAVRVVRPYAVDVSGGVEVSKGRKDPIRVQAFIREVDRASASE